MPKVVILLAGEGLLWGAAVMLDLLGVMRLVSVPVVGTLIGLSIVVLIVAAWPGIRASLDPDERLIQQDEERRRSEKKEQLKQVLRQLRKNPFLGELTIDDPDKRQVSAVVRPPRTWRSWTVHRATWLTNHCLLPTWAWLWISKRLGSRLNIEESSTPLTERDEPQ